MADNQFIEIDAPHLCVMEGESEELCNDGIYGKALAQYLQSHLISLGYDVPCIVCEDWGWYVPAETSGFRIALCVYGFPQHNQEAMATNSTDPDGAAIDPYSELPGTPLSLCVTIGTQPRKYWDWRKFRRIDRSHMIAKLMQDLISIFESDSQVAILGVTNEFPLG